LGRGRRGARPARRRGQPPRPELRADPLRARPPPPPGQHGATSGGRRTPGGRRSVTAGVAAAPVATYRLQLTPAFTFEDAAARMPYLARLGVSHAYLSPVCEAVPGSGHGYDVADPTRLREELGGEAGFRHLSEAARRAGVRLLVDVVPNHM